MKMKRRDSGTNASIGAVLGEGKFTRCEAFALSIKSCSFPYFLPKLRVLLAPMVPVKA
jgi:hypothetical protein